MGQPALRRWLFQSALSPAVVGRFGRDPHFFDYAQGSLSGHLLRRAEHALTALDPCVKPYLQWILLGLTAGRSLMRCARKTTRPSGAISIASRFGCSRSRTISAPPTHSIDGFNLSDIFEYMAPAACERLLEHLAACGPKGGRLAYWNLLAPRRRPERLGDRLRSMDALAAELHSRDKAFFYGALRVEEIQ